MTAVLVEAGPDAGAIWHFGEPNQEQRALAAGIAWADLSTPRCERSAHAIPAASARCS